MILSKEIAKTFRNWLPAVIQAVKPYYSPDDIAKGSRWNAEISQELDSSSMGLIILTKENLKAPWIMFEAGALSKNINESKVIPILFGVEPTDIVGPLTQFQGVTKFSEIEIKKIILSINNELKQNSLEGPILETVFDKWYPELENDIKAILKSNKPKREEIIRTDREILQEILELTRLKEQQTHTNISARALGLRFGSISKHLTKLYELINDSEEEQVFEQIEGIKNDLLKMIDRLNIQNEYPQTLNRLSRITSKEVGREEEND